MKFGLFYQLPCGDDQSPAGRYRDTLDQIELGDRLGFDTAWLVELHFNPHFSISPSPLLMCAAAAERTTRIRLGVAVNVIPLHNPVKMAEDIATLDVLSNGRVEFGVGRGTNPAQFQGFGVSIEENRQRFLESLEFIIGAWTQDKFSFKGSYYEATDLSLSPKPIQKPHPPIRIASNSPDTFPLVGELGHHMLASTVIVPMPQLKQGIQIFRETLQARGHGVKARELSLNSPLFVADSAREARRSTEPGVNHYLSVVKAMFGDGTGQGAPASGVRSRLLSLTYEDWYEELAIFGDPARCIEKIETLQEALQPTELICWFNPGGLLENERVMDSMRLFASEVMPRFQTNQVG